MLVLVVGPSGAGKDTLLDAARCSLAGDIRFRFVSREITRPATAGGEAHVAIDADSFAARRSTGAYALHWQAHGLGYGIPVDIRDDLAAGRVVVANASRAVIAEAAHRFRLRVLEITAPPALLAQRLGARGREAAHEITARLARSVALPDGIDVVTVVNDGTRAQGAARVLEMLSRAAADAVTG
jgi:phosphonate metabolism protein PhnN/1,5-bisphosphokinase (PRPP-forming)